MKQLEILTNINTDIKIEIIEIMKRKYSKEEVEKIIKEIKNMGETNKSVYLGILLKLMRS